MVQRIHSPVLWELIALICFVWNIIMVPFRVAFLDIPYGLSDFLLFMFVVDSITDVFGIMDIFVRNWFAFKKLHSKSASILPDDSSLTGSLIFGVTPTPSEKMSSKWICTRLLVDTIAALPLDIVYYLITRDAVVPALLRWLRLLRFIHLKTHGNVILGWFENRNLIVNAGFQRLVILWFIFTIAAHVMCCGFFAIGWRNVNGGRPSWLDTDDGDGLLELNSAVLFPEVLFANNNTVATAYIRSVYWSIITMVTTGLGDVVPASTSGLETLYGVITMFLGCSLAAFVIGNLTNLVTNLDAAEDDFHTKMDNLNKYMAYRKLSSELRDRIRAYYGYMWTSLKGVDEKAFLRELPISIRLQVAGLRSKELVKQVNFIRKAREPVINAIVVGLEQIIVSPGDYVVKAGRGMEGCYWIARGEAESVAADGVTVSETLSGKFGNQFGEGSLFFPIQHENFVRAKSYCEFLFLKKEKFQRIINEMCSHEERKSMEEQADKAQLRKAKVKKFFGMDENGGKLRRFQILCDPTSRFREIWNVVMIVAILYNAIMVPLRSGTQTFVHSDKVDALSFILDWCLDIMVLVDVFFRASCFAYIQEGIIVRNYGNIFAHYQKHQSMVLDILITLPLDILALAAGEQSLPVLRLPKILLLFYFLPCYETAVRYLAARRITLTNGFHRIVKIFIAVVIFVHIIGCIWIMMSSVTRYATGEEFNEDCSSTNQDWVCMDNLNWAAIHHTDSDMTVTYLRAVYFVLVDMTTVGYGDIVPYNALETAYVAVITLFGGLLYPAVVGAIAALIANLDSAKAEFKIKLSLLTQYMDMKRFPRDLRQRVFRYYDYLWSRQRGVDEDSILNDLPPILRVEVQEFVNGEIMRHIPFLRDADREVTSSLLSVLKPSVFLPNDTIIQAGELGEDMYLLERGATRVTSSDGKMTFALLAPGDYFGEGCLLKAEQRTATVIAISYCDCFVLNKHDFDRVTNLFPKQRRHVVQMLMDTLNTKKAQNKLIMDNMGAHPKLSQITSYEYSSRKSLPDTSWRHPESAMRKSWDVLVFIGIAYNITLIPFRICFESESGWDFIPDYCFDVVFIVDTYLRFAKFGFIFEGQVYTDEEDIRENYLKSGIAFRDTLGIIPFDLIALPLFAMGMDNTTVILAMIYARVLKLVIAGRLTGMMGTLDNIFENSRIKNYDIIYKITKLCISVVLVSHWLACFFFLVARLGSGSTEECLSMHNTVYTPSFQDCEYPAQIPGITYSFDSCPSETFYCTPGVPNSDLSCGLSPATLCKWQGTWIENQIELGLLPQQDVVNKFRHYLRALNWAIPTLVVVVIGDVVPVDIWGTFYVTVGILLGVIINATIIGSIANLVANLDGSIAKYRDKLDKLERFLYVYKIPVDLQQRTRDYLDYLWQTERGAGHADIVEDMPTTLRAEVSNFLKLKLIQDTPFFQFCDIPLQKGIAAMLHTSVFAPTDFIVYEGDLGHEMFFIEEGKVEALVFRGKWKIMDRGRNASIGSLEDNQAIDLKKIKRVGSSPILNMTLAEIDEENEVEKNAKEPIGKGAAAPTFMKDHSRSSMRASFIDIDTKLSDDDIIILSTISAGEYFGETAVFFDERRSCSVRAIDYTETYVLKKEDLDTVLMRYPLEQGKMYDVVTEIRNANIIRNQNMIDNIEKQSHDNSKLKKVLGRLGEFKTDVEKNFSGKFNSRKLSSIKSVHPIPGSDDKKKSLKSVIKDFEKKQKIKRRKVHWRNITFHPGSLFVAQWNLVCLIFAMMVYFSVTFQFAFLVNGLQPLAERKKSSPSVDEYAIPVGLSVWLAIEGLMNLFFIVDVYLRSRHFEVNKLGKIISSPNEIWRSYKNSWFWLDLIASLPLDIIIWMIPSSTITIEWFSCMSLLHLARIPRINHYMLVGERHLHDILPRIDSAVLQVGKMFVFFLVLNHTFACMWFIIHRYLEIDVHNTWVIADGMATYNATTGEHNIFNPDLSPLFLYLRSFYFTITTMSSVGFGDIRPYTVLETFMEITVILGGACTLAALIGSVAVVFFKMDTKGALAFKNKIRKMTEYMEYRELPNEMQNQIIQHYTSSWEENEGVQLDEVMDELPLPLQLELSICIHREVIFKVRGLRQLHLHVQRYLARKLVSQISAKDDYVYQEGEIGNEIYFIMEGAVKLQSKSKVELKTLGAGKHFGGDTLYSSSGERSESVNCMTQCHFYYVTKCVLENILVEFPEHRTIGIFGELIRKGEKTAGQIKRESEMTRSTQAQPVSPLSRFSAVHLEKTISSNIDVNRINSRIDSNGPNKRQESSTPLPPVFREAHKAVVGDAESSKITSPMDRTASFKMQVSQKSFKRRTSSTFEDAEQFLQSNANRKASFMPAIEPVSKEKPLAEMDSLLEKQEGFQ